MSPKPWQPVPLSDVRGIMPRNVDRLAAAGVHTLGELERFTRAGWNAVDAVLGRGTGRRVDAAVADHFTMHTELARPTPAETSDALRQEVA